MILSRDDLRAIREVVDDSVKGTNEVAGCRESAYDRYMRAAKLFEDKIKLQRIRTLMKTGKWPYYRD